MSFALRSNPVSPIAIDFGASTLKALQITRTDTPELVAAMCIETPDELLEDESARLQFQIQSIPSLIKKGGFKGKRAICSLSASRTIVQHLQLPRIEGASFGSMVAEQLRHMTDLPPSELVLRHFQIGDVMRGGRKCSEVLCVAIPRSDVMSIVRGLKQCKVDVVGMHCEHTALVPSFHAITRREQDDDLHSLYIDLGFGTTKVAMAKGRDLVFAKTIEVGGLTIDRPIARQRNCSLAEARRKRNEFLKVAPAAAHHSMSAGPASPPSMACSTDGTTAESLEPESCEAGVMIEEDRRVGELPEGHANVRSTSAPDLPRTDEFIDSLVDEIGMCLRHHQAIFPGARIGRTIFVGGESEHTNLCRDIAVRLRLHAQVASPLSCIQQRHRIKTHGLDLNKPQPGWAVPLGLCIAPTDL